MLKIQRHSGIIGWITTNIIKEGNIYRFLVGDYEDKVYKDIDGDCVFVALSEVYQIFVLGEYRNIAKVSSLYNRDNIKYICLDQQN